MEKRKRSNMGYVRNIGAWVAVLSLIVGLLANFLFSFALFVLAPLFIVGGLSFLVGQTFLWLGHRPRAA